MVSTKMFMGLSIFAMLLVGGLAAPTSINYQPPGPREGDLPFYNPKASGHQQPKDGRILNKIELEAVFDVLNLPKIEHMIVRLDGIHAYNVNQSPVQKEAGAILALSTFAKFLIMSPFKFKDDEQTAGAVYGDLKVKGMLGDAAGIREVLTKHDGDPKTLTDEQLIQLWSGNEHQNLHAVLFGNDDVKHAIHATSLSDNNRANPDQLQLGGFNDRGEFPQWGWFRASKRFMFLVSFLNKYERHTQPAADPATE